MAAIFGSRGAPNGCCSGLETVTFYALWLRVLWPAVTGVAYHAETSRSTRFGW